MTRLDRHRARQRRRVFTHADEIHVALRLNLRRRGVFPQIPSNLIECKDSEL